MTLACNGGSSRRRVIEEQQYQSSTEIKRTQEVESTEQRSLLCFEQLSNSETTTTDDGEWQSPTPSGYPQASYSLAKLCLWRNSKPLAFVSTFLLMACKDPKGSAG